MLIPEHLRQRLEAARTHPRRRPASIEPAGPGEESVWDFPRPPRVELVSEEMAVFFAGRCIARTRDGARVVETAGAPVYYFPPEDVAPSVLHPAGAGASLCEWKGFATYFDLEVDGRRSAQAAFSYPDPFDDLGQGYGRIARRIAFYASRVEEARLGDTIVTPQPGGYYAGWVKPNLRGPIKGAPGSEGW